jgi:serine/threonine protein kinase
MIGTSKKASVIHLIDFGLVKRYTCPSTGKHNPHKPDRGVFGTTRYLSKNAHQGFEQCRADDLIAFGHILIYFINGGKLPWDMKPLPPFEVDDVDPLIYQKTMQYEEDQL